MSHAAFLGVALALAVALVPATSRGEASTDTGTPQGDDERPIETPLVEEVEVSAAYAREREDAASFSDLDRAALEERHRGQDLSMLLADTPNAYAYSDAGNGVGYSYLRIRGFDQTRVAVNINGVPLNTPESRAVYTIDLADFAESLDRVQVQRGPGTSLLGAPAVGGTVNLETGNLDPTPGGRLTVGAGSFGTTRLSLRYGGAMADGRWAWMARFAHVQSDGYREPSWTRHALAHLAFQRFAPDSIWRIHVFGGPETTQLAYYGVPEPYLRGAISGDPDRDRRVNFLRDGETDTFVQPQLQVHNDRRLASGIFLRNSWYAIFGDGYFNQYADRYAYDPLGFEPPTDAWPDEPLADAWRKRQITNRQLGWLSSAAWDHRRGTLAAGAEILAHEGHHRGWVTEGARCLGSDPDDPCGTTAPLSSDPVLYDYRNTKRTAALYVRETLRPRADVAVHLEIRGTHHRYAMRDDGVRGYSFDAGYTFATPRAGVHWNIDDRWGVYAQIATGRSEPAFANVWNPQETAVDPAGSLFRSYDPVTRRLGDPVAKPERLRSFETGATFRAGASWLKANAYRMIFRDEFVFAGGLDEDGLPLTENAGQSRHEGIEIEGGTRLPGAIDLSGYAAVSRDVLDAHQVVSRLDDGTDLVIDLSGNRVALFPDHMVRVRLARGFGSARVELGVRRVGRIYTDNSEDERKTPQVRSDPANQPWVPKSVDPSTVVDLRATVDLGRLVRRDPGALSASLWVDNLLDARYETMGYSYPSDPAYGSFYTEFFPAAPRSVFVSLTWGF